MFDQVAQQLGSLTGQISDADRFSMTVVLGGKEFAIESGEIVTAINQAASAAEMTLALEPVKDLLIPYSKSEVYLGKELLVTGRLYGFRKSISKKSKKATIKINSFAADIIDSTVYPPFEYDPDSLGNLARDLIHVLDEENLLVVDEDIEYEIYDRCTADNQQTIYNFVKEIAEQKGVLITDDEKGRIRLTRANVDNQPVAKIDAVDELFQEFDGRKRFFTYRVQAISPIRKCIIEKLKRRTKEHPDGLKRRITTVQTKKEARAYDWAVPIGRQTTFDGYNIPIDGLEKAANWQRSKALADALTIDVPVQGWYPYDKNEIYRKNTLVTLFAEDIGIDDGVDLLVKAVRYRLDANGATTVLSLIPPQVYIGEELPDIFGTGASTENLLKSLKL